MAVPLCPSCFHARATLVPPMHSARSGAGPGGQPLVPIIRGV